MSMITSGVVKNGVIVPNTPLPEGTCVEIRVPAERLEVPPDLQAEFDAWDRASAETMDMVDRLLEEDSKDGKR